MKAHVQAIRHLVYQVFDSLLALHRPVFKAMGSDFLNSFTKMVDGEKDPRNLMLLFSLEKVILLEFDVKDHIEVSPPILQPLIQQDLFDVTFCYFPISFRPPPNDPYGITAEDLKTSLRGCMSASPYFAKLALPLFLEKFTTAAGPSMVSNQTHHSPILIDRWILCFLWQRVSPHMALQQFGKEARSSGRVSRQR
jgi:DNA repair/transcription protein MET18/MMS19